MTFLEFNVGKLDISTGNYLKEFIGHNDKITSVVKLNKTQIASGERGCIKIWDLHTNKCLQTFTDFTRDITIIEKISNTHIACLEDSDNIKI